MTHPDRSPILTVDGLTKTYRSDRSLLKRSGVKLTAVKNISLEIGRGEFFGLVGASGSGKTTLGRLILKLETFDAGAIRFNGLQVNDLKGSSLKTFRRQIQLIPQDPYQSLNPYLSVFDTIAEPLIIHKLGSPKDRKERVRESLEAAGLTPAGDFFQRYPHQLSGGQRQRAAIARAMVLEPDFVVADEPTSMLDASISFTIFKLLSEIQKRKNVTFLFITHDLAAARFLCNRIAVIYQGEIVETGPTREVIDQPQTEYTKFLIQAQPSFSFIRKVSAAT